MMKIACIVGMLTDRSTFFQFVIWVIFDLNRYIVFEIGDNFTLSLWSCLTSLRYIKVAASAGVHATVWERCSDGVPCFVSAWALVIMSCFILFLHTLVFGDH